jgi:hypothetical protein
MKGFTERLKEIIKTYNMQYDGMINFENPHPIDVYCYKLRGIKFAQKLGINTPIIYGIYESIDDVDFSSLPDEFVIKPQKGCGVHGVYLLVGQGEGIYYDLRKKKHYYSKDQIIKEYQKNAGTQEEGFYSQELWIEELISNPLPYDWRFNTFNGRIGAIMQCKRDCNPRISRWWNENWECINNKVIDKCYKSVDWLPEPINRIELLNVARKLSKAVKYPFVRIDLYDTIGGVYFGEITPHPAVKMWTFKKEIDNKMGKMWEEAEREL